MSTWRAWISNSYRSEIMRLEMEIRLLEKRKGISEETRQAMLPVYREALRVFEDALQCLKS